MGPSQPHDDAQSHHPSLTPQSNNVRLDDDQTEPELLSNHETELLDHSTLLLDQEHDHSRHFISQHSQARDQRRPIGHTRNQTLDSTNTDTASRRQHTQPNPSSIYEEQGGASSVPPQIHTGMDDGSRREKGYPTSTHDAYAYHHTQRGRPLLDRVTNQWRISASSPASPAAPSFSQLITAPRFRRYILMFLLVVVLPWTSWRSYGRPRWDEYRLLNEALDESLRSTSPWYGLNMRPAFLNMTHLQVLDSSRLPQRDGEKRLVFVGNVHGCYDELVSLLAKFNFNNQTDHIVFTGGLVSKGPASSSVVDLAIANSASCVRGSAEDRILLAHRDLNSQSLAFPGPGEDQDYPGSEFPRHGGPITDSLDQGSFSHGDYIDRQFTKTLTPEQASFLASCPVILDLGLLPGIGRTTAVHAGLVAGIDLENQDPMSAMNMRSIDLKTHVPSRDPSGTPWFRFWNKYQSSLPRKDRATVIYGYDSSRGLQIASYSKGIDTGCVEGGKLTALVVPIDGHNKGKQNVVSVKCQNHRADKNEGKGWDDAPFLDIHDDQHGGRGSGHYR